MGGCVYMTSAVTLVFRYMSLKLKCIARFKPPAGLIILVEAPLSPIPAESFMRYVWS